MKNFKLLTILLIFISLIISLYALNNGLALTPPMGWLTWERFRCNIDCVKDPENCISEHLIKKQADRLVKDGYLALGYEYVIIDDCWLATTRDNQTHQLQPDPIRFPNGIKALADYVHSKGLKFGIYEDYGTKTCAGYPGSMDFLQLDAQTFASWGVDYLKFDGCNSNSLQMNKGYPEMSNYLNKTGRPILFSCEWPLYDHLVGYERVSQYCNTWRNWLDVDDKFDSVYGIIDYYATKQGEFSKHQGPGAFNDPDMLVIGNYGLTVGQSRTQMAMWSLLAAPLIMSTDLTTIQPWAKDILQNRNLIAINQDKLGKMGIKFLLAYPDIDVWHKHLDNYKTAFVMINMKPFPYPTQFNVSLINLGLFDYINYNIYETFTGKLINRFSYNDTLNISINPHGDVFAFWAEPVRSKLEKIKKYSFL